MKLGIAIICKDEESSIERLLQGASRLSKDIHITDTGSTDSTLNIVKRYTTYIHHYKWKNDFADARNMAQHFLNKDVTISHILWLDADDEIIGTVDSTLLESNKAYYVKLIDAFSKEECLQLRVYPNDPNIKWNGLVHEQLNISGSSMLSGVHIVHWGYTKQSQKVKATRNLRLLKLCNEDTSVHTLMHMGHAYYLLENRKSALKCFRDALKITDDKQSVTAIRIVCDMVNVLMLDKECQRAVTLATPYLHTKHMQLQSLLGDLYGSIGKWANALVHYERALEAENEVTSYPCNYDNCWKISMYGKAECLYNMQRYQDSLDSLNTLRNGIVKVLNVYYLSGMCQWKMGAYQHAMNEFSAGFTAGDKRCKVQLDLLVQEVEELRRLR